MGTPVTVLESGLAANDGPKGQHKGLTIALDLADGSRVVFHVASVRTCRITHNAPGASHDGIEVFDVQRGRVHKCRLPSWPAAFKPRGER